MRLSIVKTVFRKELREMLRDRRSLMVMFGLPLVVYPLIAIGLATLGSEKKKELTERPGRVTVVNLEDAPGLHELLLSPESGIRLFGVDHPRQALAAGKIDAVITVPQGAERRAVAGEKIELNVALDRSRTESAFVETKLINIIADYQREVIKERLAQRGVPPIVLTPVETATTDIATASQRFGKILAQALPLLLLMTGMLGALFPALNATTTERELGTLEALLVTPATRAELLIAKGALVLVCALLTAGLNVASMSLVLLRTVSMMDRFDGALDVSVGPLVLSYVAAIPALIFFTAIVIIVGLVARNFREANSFATPVMLIPLASLAVSITEPEATTAMLITPVANTTVIIREVLTGRAEFSAFFLAFASSGIYAAIMLSLAGRLFSSEQLVNPSWEPLSLSSFRQGSGAGPRRLPAVDEVLGLFAASLVLLFYVTPSLIQFGFFAVLAGNQLLLILGPALLFGAVGRWKWKQTFLLYRPAMGMLLGAALFGIGLTPVMKTIGMVLNYYWRRDPQSGMQMVELFLPALRDHPILTIALTGVLAGICEELFFRGAVQTAFRRAFSPWVAIFAMSVLFAAAHVDLHGFPIRFLIGIGLGWIVWRSGSIFPAMLAHGLYDAAALSIGVWELHRHGWEAVLTAPVEPALQFSISDLALLAAGLLLALAGMAVMTSSLRSRPGRAEARGAEPAAGPIRTDVA